VIFQEGGNNFSKQGNSKEFPLFKYMNGLSLPPEQKLLIT